MTFLVYPVLIMWSCRSCFNNLDKTTQNWEQQHPSPKDVDIYSSLTFRTRFCITNSLIERL